MVGLSVLEWVGLTGLFWDKTGAVYREEHEQEGSQNVGAATKQALKSKVTWISAAFIFLFMGVEGMSPPASTRLSPLSVLSCKK